MPATTPAEAPASTWVVRREFHPDAGRLVDFVDDVARFRAEVIGRAVEISRRPDRDPTRFADVDRLWDDLLTRGTRRPQFRVVSAGVTAAAGAVSRRVRIGDRDLDDVIAPNEVITRYRDGGTVVLQGLHLSDPALARLANNLALELDHAVQVNAYLSPSNARGLDVHFDYHDVFVVQLDGTKRWRIWDPLPRSVDPVGAHRQPKPTFDELGPAPIDVTLEPGDVLYLPRGFPHCAETTDARSAHLTIGILTMTWHRVVRRAIDDEIAAGRLTGSVPPGALDPDAGAGSAVPDSALPDLGALGARLDTVARRHWLADQVWSRQGATRLVPRTTPPALADDDALAVTPGPLLWLTHDDGHARLHLGGRVMAMPDEALTLLASVLAAPNPFRRADLDAGSLDDESQRVVLAALAAEGVIERVAT